MIVTDRAVTSLLESRAAQGIPDHFGLRVRTRSDASAPGLRLAFTPGPTSGDEILEAGGLTVFVEEAAVPALSGLVLDVEDTPAGADLVVRRTMPPRSAA